VAQLLASSGREVTFLTAVALHLPHRQVALDHLDVTRVLFRDLEPAEIERYVAREQPLDCAGSFRCEGLGISLFRRIDSHDPTALIGLPLIWLADALRGAGIAVP
jgi:septum formation protein